MARADGLAGAGKKVDQAALMTEIDVIRRVGYGIGYDAVVEGLGAIAWPIQTPHPASTLVIALAGPTPRIRTVEAALIKKVNAILKKHQKKG